MCLTLGRKPPTLKTARNYHEKQYTGLRMKALTLETELDYFLERLFETGIWGHKEKKFPFV